MLAEHTCARRYEMVADVALWERTVVEPSSWPVPMKMYARKGKIETDVAR